VSALILVVQKHEQNNYRDGNPEEPQQNRHSVLLCLPNDYFFNNRLFYEFLQMPRFLEQPLSSFSRDQSRCSFGCASHNEPRVDIGFMAADVSSGLSTGNLR
jgi:hypothetical protein